jgi:hypothetical protein
MVGKKRGFFNDLAVACPRLERGLMRERAGYQGSGVRRRRVRGKGKHNVNVQLM